MEENTLQQQLQAYCGQGLYPLHMPGHKRRVAPAAGLPYGWDVTELPGTDDLHHPEGILAESMARAARLFGAKKTFFLVNGSTCGILAGVRAATRRGDAILMARNCHKSAWHAAELCGLRVSYLMPPWEESFGIFGSIAPQQVEAALEKMPDCRLLVLTSPTYEGVISDIAGIVAAAHRRGVAVLVDEAHGAHLNLTPYFRGGAVAAGADIVIQSAHKTLPSLTQTALAHLNGSLVSERAFARQLNVFETSSPSYPLLASLDGCVHLLEERALTWGQQLAAALQAFDQEIAGLERLAVLGHGQDAQIAHPAIFAQDASRLTVCCRGTALRGPALAERLRSQFGFEVEMASCDSIVAITSFCDEPEALRRFGQALAAIDRTLAAQPAAAPAASSPPGKPPKALCTLQQALEAPAHTVAQGQAAGAICGEYVWAYPPGIPLLAPGEVVEAAALAEMERLQAAGVTILKTHSQNAQLRVLTT